MPDGYLTVSSTMKNPGFRGFAIWMWTAEGVNTSAVRCSVNKQAFRWERESQSKKFAQSLLDPWPWHWSWSCSMALICSTVLAGKKIVGLRLLSISLNNCVNDTDAHTMRGRSTGQINPRNRKSAPTRIARLNSRAQARLVDDVMFQTRFHISHVRRRCTTLLLCCIINYKEAVAFPPCLLAVGC